MKIVFEQSSAINQESSVCITGSKSESNRLLLLQALFPHVNIANLSNSDDSQLMKKALSQSGNTTVDIHHAGTAMRFLTAYFATQEGREIELTGSQRMQERPIKILVDALKQLGAEITYKKNEGYPPLIIKGKTLTHSKVELAANVSSQYISALLLIASRLENGLEVTLNGKVTSVPYINMTLDLLQQIGVETHFEDNVIRVKPHKESNPVEQQLIVESDWSSASYFFSLVALSNVGTQIQLTSYKQHSLQGDSALVEIYKLFGVETSFEEDRMIIRKATDVSQQTEINIDLSNAPDIAQTIAVTCIGYGLSCNLTGLHTLKIKETDRLVALKTEIEKFGTFVSITEDSLKIDDIKPFNKNVFVDTYHDHRMAMAFAPLALRTAFTINDANVVSKSYPDFWNDLKKIGVKFVEA